MIAINLVDATVLLARRQRRRVHRWIIAVLASGAIAAIPAGLELSRHQKVQALKREKRVLTSLIESKRSKLNEVGIQVRNIEAQMARASALRTKRPWSRLLVLIAQALPEEIWLTSVATDPAVPAHGHRDLTASAATPASPSTGTAAAQRDDTPHVVVMEAPRAMVLEGYALRHENLYEFMSRLKGTERFLDVGLTKATEEPVLAAKAVRFSIRCRW